MLLYCKVKKSSPVQILTIQLGREINKTYNGIIIYFLISNILQVLKSRLCCIWTEYRLHTISKQTTLNYTSKKWVLWNIPLKLRWFHRGGNQGNCFATVSIQLQLAFHWCWPVVSSLFWYCGPLFKWCAETCQQSNYVGGNKKLNYDQGRIYGEGVNRPRIPPPEGRKSCLLYTSRCV